MEGGEGRGDSISKYFQFKMGLPITSKPIRTIFFECLRLPNAQNNYFSSEQIAEICNHAGNLANGVSKELVARALSNDSMSEYCLGFADLFGGEDIFTNDFVHVYVSNRFSMGGKRYTAVGRFTSEEERLDACERLVSDMNRLSFRLWNFDVISVSARTA